MGRIFETRKSTMFARWDKMAKAFTRINREIVIAVRAGGTDPKTNPLLRRALQNAKAANMPKDKVENAIKRAAGKDQKDYESILYEGYGPHGIPMIIEAATDNPTRTVANVRMHFRDYGGNLGTSGSVAYMFEHMGVFRMAPEGLDLEDLELKLIDFGLEEMGESTNEKDEPQIVIRCKFNDFGKMQAAIEEMGLNTLSSEPAYIPQNRAELPDEKANEVLELVDALEQDDDVQRVFHNLS